MDNATQKQLVRIAEKNTFFEIVRFLADLAREQESFSPPRSSERDDYRFVADTLEETAGDLEQTGL